MRCSRTIQTSFKDAYSGYGTTVLSDFLARQRLIEIPLLTYLLTLTLLESTGLYFGEET